MTRTRAEHIAWCKLRAHQEYDFYRTKEPSAAVRNAMASMLSDLGKHPDTENMLEMAAAMAFGTVRDERSLFAFIDGFN